MCNLDVLFDYVDSYWCFNSNNFIDVHRIFLWYVTTTSMIWVFLNATDTNVVPSCIIFNSFRLGYWCNIAAFFMIVQVVLNMFHNLGCHFLDLFYGLLHCTRNSYLNFRLNLGEKLTYTSRKMLLLKRLSSILSILIKNLNQKYMRLDLNQVWPLRVLFPHNGGLIQKSQAGKTIGLCLIWHLRNHLISLSQQLG